MQRDEDEYKEWQDRYEDLKEEWDGDWSKEEQRDHLENMRLANEQYVSQATLSNRALRALSAPGYLLRYKSSHAEHNTEGA